VLSHKSGTHGKSVKVGPPPNTQAFGDLPIAMSGLDISPLTVGDTEAFVKSSQKTILVGLAGVKVSSRAIVSWHQGDERSRYSL